MPDDWDGDVVVVGAGVMGSATAWCWPVFSFAGRVLWTRGFGASGHWTPGSIMREQYDSCCCLASLSETFGIVNMCAFREGWAPAEEGEIPTLFVPRGGLPPAGSEGPPT